MKKRDGSTKFNPFEGPIDDWFKLRMKTVRIFKTQRKERSEWIEELEQEN